METTNLNREVEREGFCVIDDVFSENEIGQILSNLSQATANNTNFRISTDLFAIRQVLKEVPVMVGLVFNSNLKSIINQFGAPAYFVVKSIYFDKPEQSNWVVAWHRDLTINVRERHDQHSEYKAWIKKNGQYSVQPPTNLLRNNITIRIHLDDTDESNGALKVIPGSHNTNTPEEYNDKTKEVIVRVKRGGIMLMKPLLLHASGKTTNGKPRRVIHIELSNNSLPADMEWSEYLKV